MKTTFHQLALGPERLANLVDWVDEELINLQSDGNVIKTVQYIEQGHRHIAIIQYTYTTKNKKINQTDNSIIFTDEELTILLDIVNQKLAKGTFYVGSDSNRHDVLINIVKRLTKILVI